jgi:FYVE, RhoGEF and PH domain containing 5/6
MLLVTLSLNSSLQTHADTLSLLAIQRSTTNLPFQLISPGRSLLKRGTLLLVDGSTPREREFFLFSDCVMWLSASELLSDRWPVSGSPSRPAILRARSKSDVDLSEPGERRSSSPFRFRSKPNFQPSHIKKQRLPSSGGEERWQYKGHMDLIDVEVVVSPPRERGEQYRLEMLSPQMSFAVYAGAFKCLDLYYAIHIVITL